MNTSDRQKNSGPSSGKPEPSVRPAVRLIIIGLLAVACLASAGLYLRQRSAKSVGSAPAPAALPGAEESSASLTPAPAAEPPIRESTVVAVAAKSPRPAEQRSASPAAASLPQPSPQTRQLVASLSQLDQLRSMTPEQAAQWKQNLRQLVQQGRDAVPAIAEFLKQNKDVDFGTGVNQALGYGSLRRAMFDALAQIGGPEAVWAAGETLQNSADPREIALLA